MYNEKMTVKDLVTGNQLTSSNPMLTDMWKTNRARFQSVAIPVAPKQKIADNHNNSKKDD